MFRRGESEEISDLKQQKLYLEARVASLEREIQEIRDGTHQQRIRALDLKHELREVRINHLVKRELFIYWITFHYEEFQSTMIGKNRK